MKALPESARQTWEDRGGPVILATVSSEGPRNIYATCVGAFGDGRLVVADNCAGSRRTRRRAV